MHSAVAKATSNVIPDYRPMKGKWHVKFYISYEAWERGSRCVGHLTTEYKCVASLGT